MKSPYYPEEIKSAMSLKRLTIKEIANQMSVSRRTLDYFVNGQMGMTRADEFLKILQPELGEISKTYRKVRKSEISIYEEGQI